MRDVISVHSLGNKPKKFQNISPFLLLNPSALLQASCSLIPNSVRLTVSLSKGEWVTMSPILLIQSDDYSGFKHSRITTYESTGALGLPAMHEPFRIAQPHQLLSINSPGTINIESFGWAKLEVYHASYPILQTPDARSKWPIATLLLQTPDARSKWSIATLLLRR